MKCSPWNLLISEIHAIYVAFFVKKNGGKIEPLKRENNKNVDVLMPLEMLPFEIRYACEHVRNC